jgi:hypothetical protein
MVLPGTYIEVRAEGLIGVSGIATGNLGVVGTASRGPVSQVVVLSSYAEAVETFGPYDRWSTASGAKPLTLTRLLEQAFQGGASTVYAVRVANLASGTTMEKTAWIAKDGGTTPADLFRIEAASPGTWANDIKLTYTPGSAGPPAVPTSLELVHGRSKTTFTGTTAGDLIDAINQGSTLVRATEPAAAADRGKTVASIGTAPTTAGGPSTPSTQGGPNGAGETSTEVGPGLALLATEPVHIVVVGLNANTISGKVLEHLENTENDGRERLAVLGASSDTPATIIANDVKSNARMILVAPGLLADDAARAGEANLQVALPGPYAAALVAGRLSTLAPHVSLTNKDVAADGLTTYYTRGQQKQLLGSQVLVLQRNLGIRVLKGITTDTGPFRQISVRRIVDYAKEGVRQGSNPYIGRLNNSRVRAALKATLDGFLSSMILDEMLQSYELDVSATRAQEIAGQAIVIMTLRPTFSIDFVKVIMNLE